MRFALALAERARDLRLGQTAGSLSFLSLLALVPVASIGLTVLTLMPAFGDLREAFQDFLATHLFLPDFSEAVIGYLNQFVSNAERLSLLGLAVTAVTATMTLITIEKTLNEIWATDARRSMLGRITLYWAVLTLGPLLIGASLVLSSYLWTLSLSVAGGLEQASQLWSSLLPFLLMFLGLGLLYRLVPAAPVRWRDAAAGAVLTAIVLELLKRLLGLYFTQFPAYTVVYGAFAALPIFLVWLYALWMAVLGGALIAANLRHWRTGIVPAVAFSPAARFETALGVLGQLVRAQRDQRDGVAVDSLRALLGSDSER
ncbi:MAG: YihY family inner membrane protein, partial [Burkholderiales bacterium]